MKKRNTKIKKGIRELFAKEGRKEWAIRRLKVYEKESQADD